MPRLIKRYENRKLYDVAGKRYISLEEIAALVRAGEEVAVTDNVTGVDLTAQTLSKVFVEESEKTTLPAPFLHDLLRASGRLVGSGVAQLQHGMDRIIEASLERMPVVREMREQMKAVEQRMEHLERLVRQLEEESDGNDTDRSTG